MPKLRPSISDMMINVKVLKLPHIKFSDLKYLAQLYVVCLLQWMGTRPCILFIIKTMVQTCACERNSFGNEWGAKLSHFQMSVMTVDGLKTTDSLLPDQFDNAKKLLT